MYTKAMLSDTFPGDHVCTPPPLPTPFSLVPLLSLGTHPTSFPFSNALMIDGWEGDFAFILKPNLGMVCGQGRVPLTQPLLEFPLPCFLQPHPGILPTSKGSLCRD